MKIDRISLIRVEEFTIFISVMCTFIHYEFVHNAC